MSDGPALFCSYAMPPNRLGYCGPDGKDEMQAIAGQLLFDDVEPSRIVGAFDGAWPYLELIGRLAGRDPLSREVVEAYWIGNPILDSIDLTYWGNSVSDRFKAQAGARWERVGEALQHGGAPNHAFHVFCVYPWVGLLAEGFVEPSLQVLDRCRVGWGRVVARGEGYSIVRRFPLTWRDDSLTLDAPTEDRYYTVPTLQVRTGDVVSLHWDYVCQRLDEAQHRRLRRIHDLHLATANRELQAARLEPAH